MGNLDHHLVAACQLGVDVRIVATPAINAQGSSFTEAGIEREDCFRRCHQLLQATIELGASCIESVTDDFIIQGGIDSSQLAAAFALLLGKVSLLRDPTPCRPAGIPLISTSSSCLYLTSEKCIEWPFKMSELG